MSKQRGFVFTVLLFFFIFVRSAYATIGVGVGTGKIYVDQILKSGMSYNIPPITVINTGDESSDYTVSVAYHQDQKELAPSQEWFNFNPSSFYLEPGQTQVVKIALNLPIRTTPGDYFAYLEASPEKKSEEGKTKINIAAATKLYFTVDPANIFQGLYYKAIGFWKEYSPWTNITAAFIVTFIIIYIFRKIFNIEVRLKRKKKLKNVISYTKSFKNNT